MKLEKKAVTEAMEQVLEIFDGRGLTRKERDIVWVSMAAFCAYQLQGQRGPFWKVAGRLLKRQSGEKGKASGRRSPK